MRGLVSENRHFMTEPRDDDCCGSYTHLRAADALNKQYQHMLHVLLHDEWEIKGRLLMPQGLSEEEEELATWVFNHGV